MSLRIEKVPQPRFLDRYELKLWTHNWGDLYTVVRAELQDGAGRPLEPDDGARIMLYEETDEGVHRHGWMPWHRSWRSFYTYVRGLEGRHFLAEGYMSNKVVAKAEVVSE